MKPSSADDNGKRVIRNGKVSFSSSNGMFKTFEPRNSILTDFSENASFRALIHLVWAMLAARVIYYAFRCVLLHEKCSLGTSLLAAAFSNPVRFAVTWLCLFLGYLLTYLGFSLWARIRCNGSQKDAERRKVLDLEMLLLYVLYLCAYTYYGTRLITVNQFTPIESIVLALELIRLKMKSYAFVRSSAPSVMEDHHEQFHPKLSQYVYFYFAPTMIYQSEYPRTERIRWSYVVQCFVSFFATLLVTASFAETLLLAVERVAVTPYTWIDLVLLILDCIPTVNFIFYAIHYAVFQCWLNAFAEMCRFADRMFYLNWWCSTSYLRYHQTWNLPVQEWLRYYVYEDYLKFTSSRNKMTAKVLVFFVSAIYHEYALTCGIRFFFPLMFGVFFLSSMFINFLKFGQNSLGNTIFLFFNGHGSTMMVVPYLLQFSSNYNGLFIPS